MLLYLFFHAWYSIDSPVLIHDNNSTPNPEGYIQSFDITDKQKLTIIASKLNLCLKKYGKKISVNELYPKFEWVKPSIRISGKEGYYIASFLEQIIAYNNRRISNTLYLSVNINFMIFFDWLYEDYLLEF